MIYALFFCHIVFNDSASNPASLCSFQSGPYNSVAECQEAKKYLHPSKGDTWREDFICMNKSGGWSIAE